MLPRILLPVVLIGLVLLMAIQTQAQPDDSGKTLHDIFDRDWEWRMQQSPTWASMLGDRRWNDSPKSRASTRTNAPVLKTGRPARVS